MAPLHFGNNEDGNSQPGVAELIFVSKKDFFRPVGGLFFLRAASLPAPQSRAKTHICNPETGLRAPRFVSWLRMDHGAEFRKVGARFVK